MIQVYEPIQALYATIRYGRHKWLPQFLEMLCSIFFSLSWQTSLESLSPSGRLKMMRSLHFYDELFTNKVDFIYIAPFLPRGFWDPAILTFFDVLCYEKVLQIKKSFRSPG